MTAGRGEGADTERAGLWERGKEMGSLRRGRECKMRKKTQFKKLEADHEESSLQKYGLGWGESNGAK